MENEVWKLVPEYNGAYRVSDRGRVQVCLIPGANIIGNAWRDKKLRKNKNGYILVNLTKNRISTTFYVHALVARLFIGEPPLNYEIDHRDGDRANNTLSNLHYVTHAENQSNPHAVAKRKQRAKDSGAAVIQRAISGEIISTFYSIRDAARKTGICRASISRVARGIIHNNTAGGYLWEFAKIT